MKLALRRKLRSPRPENQTHRVQPVSEQFIVTLLNSSAKRAERFLHGDASELAAAFKGSAENYKENRKEFNDMVARARSGDRDAQQELQALQITVIDNFIKVQALWASFFEQKTLGPDETAAITNVDHHQVAILSGGQDGGAPRWQNYQARTNQIIPFYALTSAEQEYMLTDWYSGAIADRAKAGLDVANDLSSQVDGRLQGYVQASIGAFTLTGNKWTRIYVPHSRIVTSNLPTSNLLAIAGNGADTLFRIACLKAIIQYCRSWGENAFSNGPLVPTAIFLPSSHFTGFLDQVEVDDPENELNRQVFEFGVVLNYGGFNWTFIADPTLDPADGLAYVRMNKPLGSHYTKPTLDRLIVDDSKAMLKQNMESILEQKVFATVVPAQSRINVLAVRYRTAS